MKGLAIICCGLIFWRCFYGWLAVGEESSTGERVAGLLFTGILTFFLGWCFWVVWR